MSSHPYLGLGEVIHAALEEGLVLVAGDVLGDVRAGALGVAHLAEDAAARAGDAFDGFERSVGIELDAVRGRAAPFIGSDPTIVAAPKSARKK
jgi:hypothetical protein